MTKTNTPEQKEFFDAVGSGDVESVRRLVKKNAEVLPPGPDHDVHNIMTFSIGQGSTPLHAVAKANRASMVTPLVDLGISPDARGGYDDASPLHVAAWNDHREVSKSLITNGANIDLTSGEIHNNTPAGWAIVAGSANVFDLLMDHGAAVLEFFEADAQAAVDGEFRKYKNAPQENCERLQQRLKAAINS